MTMSSEVNSLEAMMKLVGGRVVAMVSQKQADAQFLGLCNRPAWWRLSKPKAESCLTIITCVQLLLYWHLKKIA